MATEQKKINDSTIARIAGNIAAGLAPGLADPLYSPDSFKQGVDRIAAQSVALARAIVAEVERPVAAKEP